MYSSCLWLYNNCLIYFISLNSGLNGPGDLLNDIIGLQHKSGGTIIIFWLICYLKLLKMCMLSSIPTPSSSFYVFCWDLLCSTLHSCLIYDRQPLKCQHVKKSTLVSFRKRFSYSHLSETTALQTHYNYRVGPLANSNYVCSSRPIGLNHTKQGDNS